MNNLELSVLLVSYNTKRETAKALQCIVESTSKYSSEVLVTDNNSDDGSAEMIESEFPEVILKKNRTNRYFAPALNTMLRETVGEFVVLVNSDLFINPEAIDLIIKYMRDNQKCGIASCSIDHGSLDEGGYVGVNYWASPGFRSICERLYPFKYFRDRTRKKEINVQPVSKEESVVDVISDAFMVLRGDLFRSMGGYSKGLKLYYTEDDICIRVRRKGYTVVFLPELSVKHDSGRSTLKQNYIKITLIGARDIMVFVRIHLGLFSFLVLFPIIIFHVLTSVVYAILKSRV